jgi:D5 N terminal like
MNNAKTLVVVSEGNPWDILDPKYPKEHQDMIEKRGSRGLSELFRALTGDDYFACDSKISYYWSKYTKLWVHIEPNDLPQLIVHILSPYIDAYYDDNIRLIQVQLEGCRNYEHVTKLKQRWRDLTKIRDQCRLPSKMKGLIISINLDSINDKRVELFNSKDHLFPLAPGMVYDFKLDLCRERVKGDYFTYESPVKYNPDADPTHIAQIISSISSNDPLIATALQSIGGYTLTGCTSMKKIFVFKGREQNDFISTLHRIQGPMGSVVDKRIILRNGLSKASVSQMVNLKPKRLISPTQLFSNDVLDTSTLRTMSGGCDHLPVRDGTDFMPRFKIVTALNVLPKIDAALWDRLIIIPYEGTTEVITSPDDLSAMFNWLKEGAVRFYRTYTFDLPEVILRYTQN